MKSNSNERPINAIEWHKTDKNVAIPFYKCYKK